MFLSVCCRRRATGSETASNDKAAEMGLTAEELRRHIKTLKDIVVKALKPLPSGAGGRIRTPPRAAEMCGPVWLFGQEGGEEARPDHTQSK